MANLSLYEISNDFAILNNLLEINAHDPKFMEILYNVSGELDKKIVSIASLINNLEAQAANIAEAVTAMEERRDNICDKLEKLRQYLLDGMVASNRFKVECPYFTINVRNNPPSVNVIDNDKIPFEYFDIPKPLPKLNKNRIRDDLNKGVVILGAELTSGKSLQIK